MSQAAEQLGLESIDFARDRLAGPAFHELLTAARSVPGLTPTRLAGFPALLMTRFDEAKAFISDDEQFPGGAMYQVQLEPAIGPTFISMDGQDHHDTRQLAMTLFRSRAVTRFIDHELTPLAHEVLDRFAGHGEADLVAEFTSVLPFLAISRKLGLPRGSEDEQRRVARSLLVLPVNPVAAHAAAATVAEIACPVLDERRREPADDVLSHFLLAERDGRRLSDEEILSHIRLLYAVGATTTSDAMSNMLWLLLTHPEVLDGCRHDGELRSKVVNEALRMEPPVGVLPRSAPLGGSVAGEQLAPGALILVALAAANRDPAVFSRSDEFLPERPEREILTFGFGQKFCPGYHLGRNQLLAALTALVERLPDLRLVESSEPSGAILRSVDRLRVRWRTT